MSVISIEDQKKRCNTYPLIIVKVNLFSLVWRINFQDVKVKLIIYNRFKIPTHTKTEYRKDLGL